MAKPRKPIASSQHLEGCGPDLRYRVGNGRREDAKKGETVSDLLLPKLLKQSTELRWRGNLRSTGQNSP